MEPLAVDERASRGDGEEEETHCGKETSAWDRGLLRDLISEPSRDCRWSIVLLTSKITGTPSRA